jgi:predicted signal transduction protein with EAL and GGDEF domain
VAVETEEVAARLLAEFPHALASGQLVVYFQPEVELSSGRVAAVECLARWERDLLRSARRGRRAGRPGRFRLYGHATGDQVLADLARSCRDQVRADDIAGRYGGDEFIIMIPGTTSLRAAQLAARLTGPPTRVTSSEGMPVSVTVSVGLAESVGCGDLPDLLARADLAMYEAKRAGGACWRIFEGPRPAPARSELVEDQDSVG